MKTLTYIVLFMLSFNKGCSEKEFVKISTEISKRQSEEGLKKGKKDYYHEVRVKLSKLGILDFCCESDTCYILEAYSIESADCYGRIWNNKNKVAYMYNQGDFEFDDIGAFTKYTCELIEEWDVETIRKEEVTNSTMTMPLMINGSRIIRCDGKIHVECIQFKEFFLLERDR